MQTMKDAYQHSIEQLLNAYYRMILFVDLDDDTYELVKWMDDEWSDTTMGRETTTFTERFRCFIAGDLCHPDDKERFRACTDTQFLRNAFRKNGLKPIYVDYRRKARVEDETYRNVRLEILPHLDETDKLTAYIFVRDMEDAPQTPDNGSGRSGQDAFRGLNTSKRGILVIDDSEKDRESLADILQDDYTVFKCSNGAEGMEYLKKHSDEISLVMLDVNMPVMNGYEFLEKVSQQEYLKNIPIIVTSSISDLQKEEKCLNLGAVDFVIKPYNTGIIKSRIRNVIKMTESTAMLDVMEMDELTGVYTRQAFCHHAEVLLKRNPDTVYDLVISDIEDFKMINERYGMHVGDEILRGIGRELKKGMEHGVLTGRYNGDQFVSLMEHNEHIDEQELLLFCRTMLDNTPMRNLVTKFGIYDDVDHAAPVTVLCDRALMALRTIKHQYGKSCAKFDEELLHKVTQQQNIELDMHTALREEQFKVYYQPKHDVKSGALVGAEALIRWIHPEYGFMSPGEFIPLFEKNGFITEADTFVWKKTCENLRKWIDKGLSVVPVSVNASKLDFQQPGFVERISEPVEEYRISPDFLHIEVTESLFADNIGELVNLLKQVRKAGFQVELDDFGTGYSSLNTLGTLPLDVVKLEMSFMRQIHEERRLRVLSACINLAKSLSLKTVAEGVESDEQLSLLQTLGADVVQGFYYSRPIPADEFEEYLTKHTISEAVCHNVDLTNENKDESGVYVVDGHGLIVSFNETAHKVYPGLAVNKKYRDCFGGSCPHEIEGCVIKGPHVIWNVVRNMYENIDLFRLELPGRGVCTTVSFTTVGEEEVFAKKYREQELKAQYMTLIQALSDEYNDVYSVNLRSGEITICRYSGNAQGVADKINIGAGYREAMDYYIEHFVYEEDRERFREVTKLSHILKELENKSSSTYTYRVFRDGNVLYFNAKFFKPNDANYADSIVLAFGNVDKETRTLLAEQEKMQERNDIIRAIAGVYYATFYVDLEDNTYEIINGHDAIRQVTEGITDCQEALFRVADLLTDSEYIDRMRDFNDISTWPERLKDTDIASRRFIGLTKGKSKVNLISGKRDADGKVTHVVFTVRQVSDDDFKQA